MDIASLDRLDEYNRMNKLTKYLDNNINQDEKSDDNDDEESSYPSYLFNDNEQSATNENENINKQEVYIKYDDEDPNNTKEDYFEILRNEQLLGYHTNIEREESKIITQLTHSLHNKNVDLTSLQLQLNHTKLQLQAILLNEKKLQSECVHLQHKLAVTEQDKLLIEVHMKGIAEFEGSRQQMDGGLSIEHIRGKLLHVANHKILDLTKELSMANEHIELFQKQYGSLNTNLSSYQEVCTENESLKQELTHLSSQLAQRTVLYAAQQRKFHDNTRYMQSHFQEQHIENIQLKAMLQQVTSQFETTDKEKLNLILQNKQLEATKQSLDNQVQEMQERLYSLNNDLAEASSQNLVLQSTIDQLRTADLEELELNFTKEINTLRREAKLREDSLKKQLEDARAFVSQEAIHREEMLDEIENLRSELQSRSELLEQINRSGMPLWQQPQSTDSRILEQSQNRRDSSLAEVSDSIAFYSVLQGKTDYSNRNLAVSHHQRHKLENFEQESHLDSIDQQEEESDSAWSIAAHLLVEQVSINPQSDGIVTNKDFEKMFTSTSGSNNDRYSKQRNAVADSIESQNSNNSLWYLHDKTKKSTSALGVECDAAHGNELDKLVTLNEFIVTMNECLYSAILVNAPLQNQENYNDSFNGKVLNKLLEVYYSSSSNSNNNEEGDNSKWFSKTLSSTAVLNHNEASNLMSHVNTLKNSLGLLVKHMVHYIHKQLNQRADIESTSDDDADEVILLRRNELALKEELSKLKALLALVLRKASVLDARSNSDPVVPVEDMRFVQSTNNIISENKVVDDLKQTIQRLQTEKENSIQQVETYRDEVKYLEDLAERNLELGRHEASHIYEYQIKQLVSELNELKKQQNEHVRVSLDSVETQTNTIILEITENSTQTLPTDSLTSTLVNKKDITETRDITEMLETKQLLVAYKTYAVNLNREIQNYQLKLERLRDIFKALKIESDAKISKYLVENKLKTYEVDQLNEIINDLKMISIDKNKVNTKLLQENNYLKSKDFEIKQKLTQSELVINTLNQDLLQYSSEREQYMININELKCKLEDMNRSSSNAEHIMKDASSNTIPILDATSPNISLLDANYVKQREFQDTVTSLQLQMEAFKHLNNLVMETLQGNHKKDEVQSVLSNASEAREMQLRVELDRKIEYVNDKIFHLLEQYSHSHVQSLPLLLPTISPPQQLQAAQVVVEEVQTQTPSPTVVLTNNMSTSDTQSPPKQFHSDNLEQNSRYLQRIAELESVNSHLIEHNMELVRSSIDEKKLRYLHSSKQYDRQDHLVDISSSIEEKQQQCSDEQMKISPLYSQQLKFLESQVQHYEVVVADMQKQLIEQKNKLVAKYRSRLSKQQELFEEEKMEMVKLVRQECAEIVNETYSLLQQSQLLKQTPNNKANNSDSKNSNTQSISTNHTPSPSFPISTLSNNINSTHLSNISSMLASDTRNIVGESSKYEKNTETKLTPPKISHTTPTVTQRSRQMKASPSTQVASEPNKAGNHRLKTHLVESEQPTTSGINPDQAKGVDSISSLVERGSTRIFSSHPTTNRNTKKGNSNKTFTRSKQGSTTSSRTLYPEMISPELTLELVHSIVGRSLIHEDYKDFQEEQLQLRSSI